MEFIEDAAVRARLPRLSVWLTPEQYQEVCRSFGESHGTRVVPVRPTPPGVAWTTVKGLLARLRAAARGTGKGTSRIA